jgi:N-acetylmuramic acid 6-phosphate etherase
MNMQRTEQIHEKANGLDKLEGAEILAILLDSQVEAAKCVLPAIEPIERGARAMADAIINGNKLIYAAAGSSGLQAMADGLEITPTFGIPISQIKILRAGGLEDMSRPKGEMEDSEEAAIKDGKIIEAGDCVICLAASGNTNYPVTIMEICKKLGATTIGIANNPDTKLLENSDIPILLPTPPEVIAGSTRLGAGTAQKIALNMMSSCMGVYLGNVMDGMMVNLIANNTKLFKRSEEIVMNITDCNRHQAAQSLKKSKGSVKLAILLIEGAKTLNEAKHFLDQEMQNLRRAISALRAEKI